MGENYEENESATQASKFERVKLSVQARMKGEKQVKDRLPPPAKRKFSRRVLESKQTVLDTKELELIWFSGHWTDLAFQTLDWSGSSDIGLKRVVSQGYDQRFFRTWTVNNGNWILI